MIRKIFQPPKICIKLLVRELLNIGVQIFSRPSGSALHLVDLVCLSVCLDRTQVLCRVRYQYRGHLSRPKSLVGIFRQVTTLKSDRIVRFAQKTPKKFFPTKKQTENCVCSLSNLIISQ